MKDHGVSLNFIRELTGLGYANLAPEELVRTKDHGVSAKHISEFLAAGYSRATRRVGHAQRPRRQREVRG